MPDLVRGPRVTAADRPWARSVEQPGHGEFAERLQVEWRTVVDDLLGWRFRVRHPTVVRLGRPRVDHANATTYVRPHDGIVEVIVDGGILSGLNPEIDPRSTEAERWRFCRDLLAHEAVHRALMARYPVTTDDMDHVGRFALLADGLAPRIGLTGFPTGQHWAWPHVGRPLGYFGAAWRPAAEAHRALTIQALLEDLADEKDTAR